MKKIHFLILVQLLSSCISGLLISKMSLIGRVGIHLAFREYLVFRSWWLTALLLFGFQLLIIFLISFLKQFLNEERTKKSIYLLIILAILGLIFSYIDFTTTTHKLMKGNFHSGFYLFFISWIGSCVFFLFSLRKETNIALEEKENLSN